MENIFEENSVAPLLGDEAIVAAALESGVGFVSTYPGCPAAEIGDLMYKIKDDYGVYMEYSVNEIVALEAAAGAAFSGVRALVAMKHFGLNVAMDALIPITYTKPRAGLVIVVCDDPSCHSSAQSEQDSRAFIDNLNLLTLEPSDPQEAKDFTRLAFEISEKFQKPVIIRLTVRVAHQTAGVKIGKIKPFDAAQVKGKFIRDLKRFHTAPALVLNQKRDLLAMKNELEKELEKTNLNPIIEGKEKNIGIIASGVSHLYVLESLEKIKTSLPILKIDAFYPLPMEKINRFLKNKTKVIVFEEILGLIEERIRAESQRTGLKTEIFGKNLMEPIAELNPDRVISALTQFLEIPYPAYAEASVGRQKSAPIKADLIARTPRFCAGCPNWSIFEAIKNSVNKDEVVFVGDIGCYMMGHYPPFEIQDILLCMGASLSVAHGISKMTNQKVIAMLGDSTLLHAGLPGIINIVNNCSSPLIIIFNNGTTAMTGQQPHPATPLEFKTHDGKAEIKIENLLEAMAVKNIAVLDPVSQNKLLKEKIKEGVSKKEASVIICKHPCVYIGHLEKA